MSVEYQNQIVQQTELQHSSVQDNNNTIFVPSSQLTASPLEDPYMFEGGEDCILNQEEICYYYYGDNNHLTPEEQTLLTVDYNNNNNNNSNELYPENSIITWSSELELHDHNYIMNGPPYLYNNNNNIIEGDNFDTYNPFVSQSSMYNDGNMLLTQPLSEVTQNVIENQQFHPYDWYDLSSFPDIQQQYIIENNPNPNPNHNIISSKITEHNHQCIPPSENYYTAWTDFQLLET